MISHVGTPEADSSGSVRVMGMVTRVVFMGCVKNLCSYGRLSCWDEGCKSGEGDHRHHPHPRIECGAGSSTLPRRERGICIWYFLPASRSRGHVIPNVAKRSEESQILVFRAKLRSRKHVMTVAQHFRFLAALGMTGRWTGTDPDYSCKSVLPTPVSPSRERG